MDKIPEFYALGYKHMRENAVQHLEDHIARVKRMPHYAPVADQRIGAAQIAILETIVKELCELTVDADRVNK